MDRPPETRSVGFDPNRGETYGCFSKDPSWFHSERLSSNGLSFVIQVF